MNKNKFESGVVSSMLKIFNGEYKFKILNWEVFVLRLIMKDNNGLVIMGK